MKVTKVLVTPSVAKELLERNVKNRTIDERRVSNYAKEMQEGKWKEDTAEFIKISKSNVILDGQHRLLAVIKSNRNTYLHIAEGLSDEVFDVLDTGKVRNAVDCFKIEGIKNETTLPSIIKKYKLLKNSKVKIDFGGNEYTNSKMIEDYKERQAFWQSVAKKTKVWYNDMGKVLSPATIGGCYAVFHDCSSKSADDFMNELCSGANISNRTITALRKRLITAKTNRQNKMPEDLKHALIIKTWNVYRSGKEFKHLKWDAEIEDFPKAI